MRDARYSRKEKLLLVQVAVPQDVAQAEDPMDWVVWSPHGANAVAFEFYRQKGMGYALGKEKLSLLQNPDIRTPSDRQYDELIGHSDEPLPAHDLPADLFENGLYE